LILKVDFRFDIPNNASNKKKENQSKSNSEKFAGNKDSIHQTIQLIPKCIAIQLAISIGYLQQTYLNAIKKFPTLRYITLCLSSPISCGVRDYLRALQLCKVQQCRAAS